MLSEEGIRMTEPVRCPVPTLLITGPLLFLWPHALCFSSTNISPPSTSSDRPTCSPYLLPCVARAKEISCCTWRDSARLCSRSGWAAKKIKNENTSPSNRQPSYRPLLSALAERFDLFYPSPCFHFCLSACFCPLAMLG